MDGWKGIVYEGLWVCKVQEGGARRKGADTLGLGVRGGALFGGRGNTLRDNSGSQLWFQALDCNYDSFYRPKYPVLRNGSRFDTMHSTKITYKLRAEV